MYLLLLMLRRLFPDRALVVIGHDGRRHAVGRGTETPVVVRFKTKALPWRIVLDAPLAMGEAYTRGELVMEQGTLPQLMDMIMSGARHAHRLSETGLINATERLRRLSRRWLQFNTKSRASDAVALHYDLPFELFEMLLDKDHVQYSCAYFTQEGESLEQAQRRKVARIAAKLLLSDGLSVLEIGCGWGGLSRALTHLFALDVKAISLSREQIAVAQANKAPVHQGRVDYVYEDYRDEAGTYDRVVSIAMFEAVGLPYYQQYFDKVAACLKEDGVALVHTIGRLHGPGQTDTWTDKYIFPGGYAPALSEILPHLERSGLMLGDVEIWQDQYAVTIAAWYERLMEQAEQVVARFGMQVFRMFEFYLCAARTAFVHGDQAIFQIQMVKKRGVLPASRRYIEEHSDRLAQRLGERPERRNVIAPDHIRFTLENNIDAY